MKTIQYTILFIVFLLSNSVFAHGSSHPSHYSYHQVGMDLIETREANGRSSIKVYENYFDPKRIEARRLKEIEDRKFAAKVSDAMVIPGFLFVILAIIVGVLLVKDSYFPKTPKK